MEKPKMNAFRFIKGIIGETRGKFLTPVDYVQGQTEPRFSLVVGDDNGSLYYVYDPKNEIEINIDITQDEENAQFVQLAKAAIKDDSAPLLLVTEDETSIRAVVWEVVENNLVKIKIQPDDGTWGIIS